MNIKNHQSAFICEVFLFLHIFYISFYTHLVFDFFFQRHFYIIYVHIVAFLFYSTKGLIFFLRLFLRSFIVIVLIFSWGIFRHSYLLDKVYEKINTKKTDLLEDLKMMQELIKSWYFCNLNNFFTHYPIKSSKLLYRYYFWKLFQVIIINFILLLFFFTKLNEV